MFQTEPRGAESRMEEVMVAADSLIRLGDPPDEYSEEVRRRPDQLMICLFVGPVLTVRYLVVIYQLDCLWLH